MATGKSLPALELVPLDAPWPQPAAAKAPPAAAASERERVRLAYLRARFPAVIREERDLADAARVAEAARCYAADGRIDRARELADLVPAAFPELGAFDDPDQRFAMAAPEAADGCRASGHAARIRRLLVLEGDGQDKPH